MSLDLLCSHKYAEIMKQNLFLILFLIFFGACDTSAPQREGFLAEPGPILFISDESGTSQLYSMQPDGSDVRQLTDDPDFPIGRAVWSPEGSKIVLEGPQEALHYGPALYVVNADGTGRYRLTHTVTPEHLANGERPVWSPDGRRIAFRRIMIPEALGILDIYVVDVGGANEQRVTNTPNILEYIGAWTPEGYLLGDIFDYSYRDSLGRAAENGRLVALDLDGTYQWTWGQKGEVVKGAILSPDGSKIAFNVRIQLETDFGNGVVARDVQEEVHVMDVDGANRRQLTHSEHKYLWPVAWSPDGTSLLVQAGTPPGKGSERILVVPLDGSGPVDITPCQGTFHFCYPTSWKRR